MIFESVTGAPFHDGPEYFLTVKISHLVERVHRDHTRQSGSTATRPDASTRTDNVSSPTRMPRTSNVPSRVLAEPRATACPAGRGVDVEPGHRGQAGQRCGGGPGLRPAGRRVVAGDTPRPGRRVAAVQLGQPVGHALGGRDEPRGELRGLLEACPSRARPRTATAVSCGHTEPPW